MIAYIKAFFRFVTAAVIIICAAACGFGNDTQIKWRPSETDEARLNVNANVSVQTEYPSYPPGVKSLNVIISNNTGDTLDYGAAYIIERKIDGKWHSASMDDIAWIMIAYLIRPGETHTHEIKFDVLDSPPPDGEYRIIKEIGGDMYCAMFSIAAAG